MVVHDLASLKCLSPPPCPQVPPTSPKILNPKWLYMFPNPKCGRKWRLSVGASEAGPHQGTGAPVSGAIQNDGECWGNIGKSVGKW